jgi:hypothetical protein
MVRRSGINGAAMVMAALTGQGKIRQTRESGGERALARPYRTSLNCRDMLQHVRCLKSKFQIICETKQSAGLYSSITYDNFLWG